MLIQLITAQLPGCFRHTMSRENMLYTVSGGGGRRRVAHGRERGREGTRERGNEGGRERGREGTKEGGKKGELCRF